MPAEIGPQISKIDADLGAKSDNPRITRIEQKEEDKGTLYRGRYVEPDRISSSRPDTEYKVIYCVATLEE